MKFRRGVVIVLCWLAITAGGTCLLSRDMARVVWTASAGGAPPSTFRYLMFPARSGPVLADTRDGSPAAPLDRAVANTQEELDSPGRIRVNGADHERWIERADLSFVPADGDWATAIAAWRSFVDSTYAIPRQRAYARSSPLEDGKFSVIVKVIWVTDDMHNGDMQQWEYETDGNSVKPKRALSYSTMAVAFQVAGNACLCGLASAIPIVIGLVAWTASRKRSTQPNGD